MLKYILRCLKCGKEYDSWRMSCIDGCDSLLRTEYRQKRFGPSQEGSFFKYIDWLPFSTPADIRVGPVVLKSEALAQKIGLDNLYYAFNGYWPRKDAFNMTGTFKDFEAWSVLMNFISRGEQRAALASSGNFASALAYAASTMGFEIFIFIPEKMISSLWLPENKSKENIHVVAVKCGSDYYRAIELCREFSEEKKIAIAGSARSAAGRDGMGTVMLEAARIIGCVPEHYFQAIGSGTGGIAAHEASLRLLGDERFSGQRCPRFHFSQNEPFTPVYWAWKEGRRIQPDVDIEGQNRAIEQVCAPMLTNRSPAYSVRGGLMDILSATQGEVYKVSNKEALMASAMFEEAEGVDVVSAAAVCIASLLQAVERGEDKKKDTVLLNITGGGLKALRKEHGRRQLEPEILIDGSGRGMEKIL